MDEHIGIRELRAHLTQTIRRVRQGRSITVTHGGDPVARIIPIPADALDEMYTRGEIVRGTPLDDAIVPHDPLPGTPSSEDIVSQGRDED
jgi:prevent-host-death family protein